MIIKILGCGSSTGTPVINGDWGKCDKNNIKNYRTRSSIILMKKDKNILIDAGPDLRYQCIKNNIKKIDEVLITHAHNDHFLGLADLPKYSQPIPVYCHIEYKKTILNVFEYSIKKKFMEINTFDKIINTNFQKNIIVIKQNHGSCFSYGFRIGNFAYCTDILKFEENEIQKLSRVKLLIIGCIDYVDHKSHAGYKKVCEWIKFINPTKTILTHMNNQMNYKELNGNIKMAYDTMTIDASCFMEC